MALAHPCVFPIALRALVALFPLFGVPDGFIPVGGMADWFDLLGGCARAPSRSRAAEGSARVAMPATWGMGSPGEWGDR